jgi:hypothetical protein
LPVFARKPALSIVADVDADTLVITIRATSAVKALIFLSFLMYRCIWAIAAKVGGTVSYASAIERHRGASRTPLGGK